MVDYIYKDLYSKPHVDKQVEIIACDFICYGNPQNIYEGKDEYDRKIFLDALSGIYYMLVKNVNSYKWDVIRKNDGKLIVFRNKDIDWENFELSESLCSETELRFGCCEASVLKFRIHNTFVSLKDKWLTAAEVLDGHTDFPFQFGRYKVFSDVPTADRLYRDVTAYDSMYDIINSSAINWYNTILPKKDSKVTMRQFRDSFINYFGLQQKEITLVNDDMIVEKTIQVGEGTEIDNETEQVSILKESSLSGLDVIRAICEINGCFGHIGRDGKFHYIYLMQDVMGLYPSNTLFPDHAPDYLPQAETGHLYPQSPKGTRIGNGTYISADYEDFICRKINKLQIRQKENDIGAQFPEGKVKNENNYIIEGNFLVYGKTAEKLSVITKNIFEKIKDVVYRPFSAEFQGNPCLEVGDAVRVSTRYELIESYILKRTLKGIQDLRDSYSSEGSERYSGKVNSVSSSIIQLKGKTNILERNVDETKSEIKDVGEGLSSRITQLVNGITMEVSNDKEGKTADIKLYVKDGETIHEVNADKIDFTGLVSFKNLSDSGETTINGDNIKTGTIQSIKIRNGDGENGKYPFSVDESGNAQMKSAKITGGSFDINDKFIVDESGNAQMKSAKITGGSFNINDKFTVDKSGNVEMKSAIVNGNITAVDGLTFQYESNTLPPIASTYKFAKTSYTIPVNGGIEQAYANIYSPNGARVISIGNQNFEEKPGEIKTKDMAYFPNGAMIRSAYVESLQTTYKEKISVIESGKGGDIDGEEGVEEGNGVNVLTFVIRKSGAFVSFYGKHMPYMQKSKEATVYTISDASGFLPTHHSCKTVGYAGGRLFLFSLYQTEEGVGKLKVINFGEDFNSSNHLEVQFRMDYFIFP